MLGRRARPRPTSATSSSTGCAALGADGPSYDTIVASGPDNAARPHHQTGRRTIVEGDTVIIDVGALVDGYHSDMTRTFVVGEPDAPSSERSTTSCSRPSSPGSPRSRAGVAGRRRRRGVPRPCSRDAGYGDWFIHGTGHGVGLDIHEDPFASPRLDGRAAGRGTW